ncbi:hypothetical protein LXG23DRAFT_52145 [Yarrowia lipolytica]|nr:hypothetical protein YALI1_B23771g [Yarrowia lipolytica]KAJ8052666.1 hypothetical protein LXG23DRAFT_52145 [Yarrowia lipolytica]
MAHEYKYDVAMSCSGCSNAVNRVLQKKEGVTSVDIDLEKQSVLVKTDDAVSYDDVLATIAKTGKKVNGGQVIA